MNAGYGVNKGTILTLSVTQFWRGILEIQRESLSQESVLQ